MERWNLHRKLALKFLLLIGERPRMMMAGFMAITAFLSMWISNTATTSMMTPLVLAVLGQISADKKTKSPEADSNGDSNNIDSPISLDGDNEHHLDEDHHELETITGNSGDDNAVELELVSSSTDQAEAIAHDEDHKRFSKACLLGIAYSASLGGTATLVGTGTNVILVQTFSRLFPSATPISFGGWFLFATPLALLLIAISFGILTVMFTRNTSVTISRHHLEAEHDRVGPMSWAQVVLLIDLVLMVIAWFIRPILTNHGILKSGYITDGTISMVAGLVLFIIPSRQDTAPGHSAETASRASDFEETGMNEDEIPKELPKHKKMTRLADNDTLLDLPWDIIMLLGGGLALAEGFQASGLSILLANKLNILSHLPLYFMISLVCLIVLFTTELTSNIATVTLVLPILAAMAQSNSQHPLLLMIPATICCSLAFMLPVATPPNAIVFSSNVLRVVDMAKAGLFLNILSLILVPSYMLTLGSLIFGINFKEFPDWAKIPEAPASPPD